jgi:hypothetical protein
LHFQEREVKKVIFDMRSDASADPNGSGVHFFKSFWPIIKGDYMAMMDDFHKASFVSTGSIPIGMDKYNNKIMIITIRDPDLFRVEN